MVSDLWIEKYRPKKIEDYVFQDSRLKRQVMNWISENSIPHLLLFGSPGTGKSSLVSVLLHNLQVDSGDILYMNCSNHTGVDAIRDKVISFVSTVPNGDFKIVLMEEADRLSQNAQDIMRRVMEDYSESARFILTGNHVHRIDPALMSRCQSIQLQKPDPEEFHLRVATILIEHENVEVDSETLEAYVTATYPDLRKCIGQMELNVVNGKLLPLEDSSSSVEWMVKAADLFNQGKISEGRKLVCSAIRPDQCDEFFSMCYRNLHWWSSEELMQDLSVVIIRDAIVKNASVADIEINIAAMLIELAKINRGEF